MLCAINKKGSLYRLKINHLSDPNHEFILDTVVYMVASNYPLKTALEINTLWPRIREEWQPSGKYGLFAKVANTL
jgi:hypothetical protein